MRRKQIYNAFNIVFAFFLTVIVIGTIFNNQSQIKNTEVVPLLFSIAGVLFILVYIYRFFGKLDSKIMTKKKEILIFAIIMLLIITIEIFCGYNLAVSGKRFDLGNVMDIVDSIMKGDIVSDASIAYYTVCPNNKFLIFILIYVYKIFYMIGITDRLIPGITINIIFITLSIAITYLIIRKLYDNKKALIMLGFTLFLTPLFLYVPIFYTDTMSLPFVMLVFYMYLIFKEEKNHFSKKGIVSFILLNIFALIGITIKTTVGIILIAIYIDMIFTMKSVKNSMPIILVSICMVSIFFFLSNLLLDSSGYFEKEKNKKFLPYTTWAMLGLNESKQIDKPVYQESDFQYDVKDKNIKPVYGVWEFHEFLYATDVIQDVDMNFYENLLESNLTYDEINQRCMDMIKKRLKERGILGTILFEYKKMIQTWGDGTYYIPAKISRFPIRENNLLADFIRLDGKYFDIYYYFAHAIQVIMLSLILLSTVLAIKKKNDDLNVLRVAIFGLMLFLMIWETRSRYVLNYILLMYILIMPTVDYLTNYFNKNKIKKSHIM